jgi:hypothetical protein
MVATLWKKPSACEQEKIAELQENSPIADIEDNKL